MDQHSGGPSTGTITAPASDDGGHPLLRLVAHLRDDIKSCRDVDPMYLPSDVKADLLLDMTQLEAQLEALRMRLMAGSSDVAELVGNKDVATWLARAMHTHRASQASAEKLGMSLESRWQLVGAAVRDGRASLDQARVATRCLDDLADALRAVAAEGTGLFAVRRPDGPGERVVVGTDELLALAEAVVVDECDHLGPRELQVVAETILHHLAPEVADEAERLQLEAAQRRAAATTRLSITNRGDGSADLRGRIPQVIAARLRAHIDGYTSPRHDSMTDGSLRDAATGELLPADRRMGEGFCALVENIDPTPHPTQAGASTRIVITMDVEALRTGLGAATLADGTRISAAEARRLACNAELVPAVLGTDSEVLDLGRSTRLFTPAQRLAKVAQMIRARGHATCQAEGCTRSAHWAEAHHRKAWAEGGSTDLDHLDLLCNWHHHRVHDQRYRHHRAPDGTYTFHRRT